MKGLATRVRPEVSFTKLFLLRFGLGRKLENWKKSRVSAPWPVVGTSLFISGLLRRQSYTEHRTKGRGRRRQAGGLERCGRGRLDPSCRWVCHHCKNSVTVRAREEKLLESFELKMNLIIFTSDMIMIIISTSWTVTKTK